MIGLIRESRTPAGMGLLAALLFLTLLISGCATTKVLPPVLPATLPVDFTGVVTRGLEQESETEFVGSLNASWVRQGFFWARLEREQGVWTWTGRDEFVQRAETLGLKILAVLDYDTPWVRPPGRSQEYIPPEYYPAWENYVRQVVRRYKDRVGAFEIWNEPNLGWFWSGTKEEFAAIAVLAARVIREEAPQAKILGPGFFGVPEDWIEACTRAGLWELVDGLAFHPYWVSELDALALVDAARRQADKTGKNLELWVTEVGWPTQGYYLTTADPQEQAVRLSRFLLGAALRGVKTVVTYMTTDADVRGSWDSEHYFGLATAEGAPKPAAEEFRRVSRVLSGATVRGRVPDLPPGWEGLLLDHPEKGTFLVVWKEDRGEDAGEISVPGGIVPEGGEVTVSGDPENVWKGQVGRSPLYFLLPGGTEGLKVRRQPHEGG